MRVVLPLPFFPIIPNILPFCKDKEIESTAVKELFLELRLCAMLKLFETLSSFTEIFSRLKIFPPYFSQVF